MIDAALWALSAAVAALTAGLYLCLAASLRHFRRPAGAGAVPPMTLIRPIRGLDDGLIENLESLASSDIEGVHQIVIALESASDPAYQAARRFADAHPERDIALVLSGPPGGRMGKVHNMIAALARAKHPFVVFSDADTGATERLLRETGLAFAAGYEAVYALPHQAPTDGLGGVMLESAINHTLGTAGALAHALGQLRHCAGAWMGFSREALARAGGLEPMAHAIADDFALSMRMHEIGARRTLVSALAPLGETGTGLPDAAARLSKWSAIIHCCLPGAYWAAPAFNLGLLALALWLGSELSGTRLTLGRGLAAAAFLSRGLVAWLQDWLIAGRPRGPARYAMIMFSDLGWLGFWASGFRSELLWRGVRYRLKPGGLSEVV